MIILFGGSSYEHEISIVSAITIKDKIHDAEFVFVDRDRNFYLIDKKDLKSKYFASFEYKKSPKLSITQGGFEYKRLLKTIKISDIVLNLIHGRDGEDGKIAALMQFYNIKCITPSIEASAISYNKLFTKMYAKEQKVKVLDYVCVDNYSYKPPKYPVIIKPLRLGSSIGVSIARNDEEYEYALDVAFEFDKDVLIEEFIEGINEYNLAGTKIKDKIIFSKIESVKKTHFLSYEDKYLDFSKKEIKVDIISNDIEAKLKEAFSKIYGNLFEGSLIRCDFFEINGEVYLNEINPIPGSMASYLFDDFEDIINKLKEEVKFEKYIDINYEYINKIQMAKGK